jgi:hypothetical protein
MTVIAVRELDPTTDLALKHNQLMSERGILSLKLANRPKRRNQQPQKEEEQRDHRGRRYVIASPDQVNEVFGTHSSYAPIAAQGRADPPLPSRLLVARWRRQFWADCTTNISGRKFPIWTTNIASEPNLHAE